MVSDPLWTLPPPVFFIFYPSNLLPVPQSLHPLHGDVSSWIYKHSSTTKHPRAKDEDFEVLATNYPDRRRRKLAEAMFIRDLKPSLNKQKESYKLVLFNWRSNVIGSHMTSSWMRTLQRRIYMLSLTVFWLVLLWCLAVSRRSTQFQKMQPLLVVIFLIKILARSNLFNKN